VPRPAIHAGLWPAITRRLWLGARDPEAQQHYRTGH
jgi:hypothetical protein